MLKISSDTKRKEIENILQIMGYCAIPEIIDYFKRYPEECLYYPELISELQSLKYHNLKNIIENLVSNPNSSIIKYEVEGEFRIRYGLNQIQEINSSLRRELKTEVKLTFCHECFNPVILYKDSIKHFYSRVRCPIIKNDEPNLMKIQDKDGISYIITKSKILGVYDEKKKEIRFPQYYKKGEEKKTEYVRILEIAKKKGIIDKIDNLKIHFKETFSDYYGK